MAKIKNNDEKEIKKEQKKVVKKKTKVKEIAEEELPKENYNNVSSDIKVYNVLSYIGILWLVGLLGPDKDNSKVKFHVGQGILVSIVWLIVMLINDLIIAKLFRQTYVVLKVTYIGGTSVFGYFLMGLLSLIPIAFSIIGIINAFREEEIELPIIGKYSFYK